MKILIIEDNPKDLKLERDLLIVGGFDVIDAEDAESGIVMAQQEHPDAIITDYLLPGMNGVEAIKLLNANEKTKNIPKAFVTASITEEIKTNMEASGCPVIAKPINTRTFAEQIRRLLK